MREPDAVETGPDISRVMSEADTAGRNGERSAERELPDKQEGQEASESLRTVNLLQVLIGAASLRHGSAEFSPDQTVAQCKQRAGNPTQYGLGASGRDYDEWQRDERTDADHVNHVQRGGAGEADAADQFRLWRLTWAHVPRLAD